jgi:hypothetical protein
MIVPPRILIAHVVPDRREQRAAERPTGDRELDRHANDG